MMFDLDGMDMGEIGIWAEGTKYRTDELAAMYSDYAHVETLFGREPLEVGRWAETVIGIPNE